MMKFISFILCIYMAFLISLPCADNQECDVVVGTQKIMESTNHHEHSHTSESCPPLCVCMCCTSYAYFQEFRGTPIPPMELVILGHPYRQTFLSYETQSIWQPPKIA